MTDLGSLGGTTTGSSGDAINLSGEVAGTSQTKTAGVTHAALWTGTKTVDLGALAPLSSGSWSSATGINDSGQVVGYWAPSLNTTSTESHPWLYSNGTMTSLPVPSNLTAPSCTPAAINNNGQIAGSGTTSTGATDGFLDSNGTVTDLGTFRPSALNDNRVMVGVSLIDSGGTVQDLNNLIPAKSGYQINDALAINDNGLIAAEASRAAVLLTPN